MAMRGGLACMSLAAIRLFKMLAFCSSSFFPARINSFSLLAVELARQKWRAVHPECAPLYIGMLFTSQKVNVKACHAWGERKAHRHARRKPIIAGLILIARSQQRFDRTTFECFLPSLILRYFT